MERRQIEPRFSEATRIRIKSPMLPAVVWSLLVIVTMMPSAGNTADAVKSTTHRITPADGAIELDGVLDEPAWRSAWVTELPFEVHPGENIAAPVRTEVLLTYDASHLYIGFRAYDDNPKAIRAHLSDRDDAQNDDWVGVVLDTFNDERRHYLLRVNPLGVQMDNIEAESNGTTAWDGIWASAATITDWGWTAELRVPFSTLRFQRSGGPQVWGFDAIRGYPRSVFHRMGTFPRDRSNNCYLCQALKIEGFEGVTPGRNLEIVPTLTSARTDERVDFPEGALEAGAGDVEGGVTARWGITPNLTLSGTINPDYSQVEADARQLDINEPFALFFPEKRPFFMEGADFFSTPLNAVYTRMLRDPVWGLKLTGKEGAHTIGSYVVQDGVTNIIFPGSQGSDAASVEMDNTAKVARYKYDLGSRYTFGALITDREGHDYFNRVAGVDGNLRLSETDRIVAQFLGSSTRYPDDVAEQYTQPLGEFDDVAVDLLYAHDTRTWGWWGMYRDIGRDFRADLGFMPRVDFRHREAGVSRKWIQTESSWYSQLRLVGKVSYADDHNGELLENETAVMFVYEGPMQSHSIVRPSRMREGYNGTEFDLQRLFLHTCLKPNAHSRVWLNVTIGDQVDYANTRPGEHLNVAAGLRYRLGRHLYLEVSNTHENMDVADGWLYKANVAQLTGAWQFTRRTFLRAILQHVDYDYNVALYEDEMDPRYQHLFTQLLFSYKLNPQTVFFVGYSDNSYGDHDIGLTQENRTVFIKLGYAFVL